MPFKIRDLMIDLVSESPGAGEARYCPLPSVPNLACINFTTRVACTQSNGCGLHSAPYFALCDFSAPLTDPGPRDLGALKAQLRAALAEVEERERAVEAESRPRTREEAEELEGKLQEALEELRSLKKSLPADR